MTHLKTTNPHFGFYGTILSYDRDPDPAWEAAMNAVASWWPTAHPKLAARRARLFLDSPGGRHLADAVSDADDVQAAIKAQLPSFASWLR